MYIIVLLLLVVLLVGTVPRWPHSREWGYGPSGIVGVLLIIVLVAYLMGYRV